MSGRVGPFLEQRYEIAVIPHYHFLAISYHITEPVADLE